MIKLAEYYTHFVQDGNVIRKFDIPSEHAIVVINTINTCTQYNDHYYYYYSR